MHTFTVCHSFVAVYMYMRPVSTLGGAGATVSPSVILTMAVKAPKRHLVPKAPEKNGRCLISSVEEDVTL